MLWASCSIYDETLLHEKEGGIGTSGGSGGTTAEAGDTGGIGAATCESAQPPDKSTQAQTGTNVPAFIVAMNHIDFGEPLKNVADAGPDGASADLPWRRHGFDLDHKCTVSSSTNSCIIPDWAHGPNWGPGDSTDFTGGRDNSLGRIIEQTSVRVPDFGTPRYNQQIERGAVSLLFKVDGYNGQKDDDQITVTLYTPAPLNAFSPSTPIIPKWDGTDNWPIASSSLNNNDINDPKFIDKNGYVANGVLVAGIKQADLRLSIGIASNVVVELLLRFSNAFFVGELDKNAQGLWTLQAGEIGGIWNVNDLLHQLDQFPDPVLNVQTLKEPICTNSGSYITFRRLICSQVDISASGTAPTNLCDALSVGIGFTGIQAKVGSIYELQPLKDRCLAKFGSTIYSPANLDCEDPEPIGDAGDEAGGAAGADSGDASDGASGADASLD
jgi:hypothetical protein